MFSFFGMFADPMDGLREQVDIGVDEVFEPLRARLPLGAMISAVDAAAQPSKDSSRVQPV